MFGAFTGFLSLLTGLLNMFILIFGLYPTPDENSDFGAQQIIVICMMVYGATITCCVGGLTSYHGKLACNNETTNEEIRGKYGGALGNPYDKGCSTNCHEFCFKY